MKKTVVPALIIISLMALGAVSILPVKAQYQGDIIINADGSLTPSTAPIQRTSNIYALTSKVVGNIQVSRNNTVLDGNGYAVGSLLLSDMSNVTVENFSLTDYPQADMGGPTIGISLSDSSDVVIANNSITGIWNIFIFDDVLYAGIYVEGGGSNVISGNTFGGNGGDLYLVQTQDNLIVGNNITDGIFLDGSSKNTIYHNNFFYTFDVSPDKDAINVWDDGYPSGGNYWKGYYAAEIGSSAIGNTPFAVDSNNTDRYPLIEPFNSTFYTLQTTPPEVSLQSPFNQAYGNFSVPLAFSVDVLAPVKAVNWTGYSLDGKQNVTVTDSTMLTGLSSGRHNITVYANDTYGNMGASETVNFTIPQPFPTLTVVAVSAAIVIVVIGAILLVNFEKRKRQK